MVDLLKRQQELWQLLQNTAEKPPMLRISRDDDSFWICDLPRRCGVDVCQAVAQRASGAGFVVQLDEQARLWKIDLPLDDPMFSEIQKGILPFPQKDALHCVYALYRLLLKHSAPAENQSWSLVRGIVKLTTSCPEGRIHQTLQFIERCAALLNRQKTLPSAACYALYQYISQEDEQ